jgi:epothilone polyketide synthase D
MSTPMQETDRLRESLAAIRQLKAEVERLRAQRDEQIAVVGMGCRFPGGADSPAAYWDLLRAGRDAIARVPADRWDADQLHDADRGAPGKACTTEGGFLQHVDAFDAAFFGISPREALRLDPQQRLLLEVAWEALENAAIAPDGLYNSRTGVFIGICSSDYVGLTAPDLASIDAYVGTGNAHSTAAGRLSFFLGLRGPSLAVDTACSSSLVGVHLACQSLRAHECDLALAAGVNLMLSPALTVNFSQAGMLAPDGRCKSFDARADGYARGEGCGVVVLRRLSDALAASDPILAVVKGSAVNQDGKSSGLTVPNGPAQAAVIRDALARAGVAATDVGYVEAHATGTALGDPIELHALRDAYAQQRAADDPLVIGAVKTNIGHLEAAAGIAGLVKAVLCVRHGRIPANLHMRTLNPRIRLDGAPIVFPTQARAWPGIDGVRRAGVSSFGFGGTNAHLVIESAPPRPADPAQPDGPHLLLLSARTPGALDVLTRQAAGMLSGAPHIADVCRMSQCGRTHFAHRVAVLGDDAPQLATALAAHAEGRAAAVLRGEATGVPKVAFLFTGQGSQYAGMGQGLYGREPIFRRAVDECDEILRPLLAVRLQEVLAPKGAEGAGLLAQTQFAQPALVALELALAALWKSWGVRPEIVLGHSVGEFAAACVAGAIGMEDVMLLVARRGAAMQAVSSDGAMASVFLDREQLAGHLAAVASGICIAADNGPRHLVVSARADLVDALLERLAGHKVAFRRLAATTAFHSTWMKPAEPALRQAALGASFRRPSLPFVSSVTGRLETDAITNADYWVAQACEPTEFATAMCALADCKPDAFVEIGPQPTLVALGQACVPELRGPWLPSLRPREADRRCMLGSLAALHVRGAAVVWRAVQGGSAAGGAVLPTYPFERKRYWPAVARTAPPPPVAHEQDAGAGRCSFAIDWREAPRPREAARTPGAFLLITGGSVLATHVGAALERLGFEVGADAIDTADAAAHLRAQVAALKARRTVLRGIACLWEAETPAQPASGDELLAAAGAGAGVLLACLQAMVAEGVPAGLPVWLVTRGCVAAQAGEPALALARAPAWGLMKALAVERHDLLTGGIDLAASTPSEPRLEAEELVAEMLAGDRERFVALRGRQRLVARLQRMPWQDPGPLRLRADRSYLVAGGTGALGMRMADLLVRRGARQLVLVSRSGACAGADLALLEGWRRDGVQVRLCAADIAQRDDIDTLRKEIARDLAPLGGIVHAAGEVLVASLEATSAAALQSLLRSKLAGGWHLHELAGDAELDLFVCCSSTAAVWGSPGLLAYAAANQCLDALALHRRALGRPALSVNWGPWEQVGMATSEVADALVRAGISALPLRQATAALEGLIGQRIAQATVANVDWPTFGPLYAAATRLPLLDELALEPGARNAAARGDGALRLRLADATPAERRRLLSQFVRVQVARVLRMEAGALVPPRTGFFDLGMDSLMKLELHRALEAALDWRLPSTLAFDCPNVDALVDHLLGLLFPQADEPVPVAAPTRDSGFDALSDAELADRLATRLRRLGPDLRP